MTSPPRPVRILLNATLTPLIALVLLFEEWGWEPMTRVMRQLGRLPLWRAMERQIARLHPTAAMVLFLLPGVILLPAKVLGLYWLAEGHAAAGVTLLVVAKIVGTAALAWLFPLTRPALLRLRWFARWYPRWRYWKESILLRAQASAPWRGARLLRLRLQRAWLKLRGAPRRKPAHAKAARVRR